MTKKDYELIARIIYKDVQFTQSGVKHTPHQIMVAVARQFADVLNKKDPKFQKAKFLKQCGVEEAAYVNNKGKTVNYS